MKPEVNTEQLVFDRESYSHLMQVLYQATGINFGYYAEASLQRRLVRAMQLFNIDTLADLEARLQTPDFQDLLVSELTVGVTEFYRDPEMWQWLRQYSREVLRHKTDLSIWHAGCSSGEELFSASMLLQEEGVKNAHLLGTDVSQLAVQRARMAHFSPRKMELLTKNYVKSGGQGKVVDWFKQNGPNFAAKPEITSNALFKASNLFGEKPAPGSYDLIMCRNVLIYFEMNWQEALLDVFHQALKPGGLLILGLYESLAWSDKSALFKQISPGLNVNAKR